MSEAVEKSLETSDHHPKKYRAGKLSTLVEIRQKMVWLYGQTEGEEIEIGRAKSLMWMLDRIRSCISESELEQRVSDLEERLGNEST